ncbi:Tn3 family transposase [Streptomyces sp. NPDC056910]|uniref:Tn3 family transposase n=1 Tax=Streptomyces sp. NPDC056910 TaxID=3345964 RepID=UPI0036774A1E
MLTQKINMGLIEENWDDLLRLATSIKFGHATASLIVGKLSASCRQNTLAAVLKEYGRSHWRRRHQAHARHCHYMRRGHTFAGRSAKAAPRPNPPRYTPHTQAVDQQ